MLNRKMNNIVLDVRSPEYFRMKEVILINLLSIPPGFVAGVLLALGTYGTVAVPSLGPYARPLPLVLMPFIVALALSLVLFYFAPLLFAVNYYVRFLVRRYARTPPANGYVCQLSVKPRLSGGAKAFLEDADDIGVLNLNDNALSFTGDHVNLYLPYSSIASVNQRNIGWRGAWILRGSRLRVHLASGAQYTYFEFLERESNTVNSSKKLSNMIYSALQERMQQA